MKTNDYETIEKEAEHIVDEWVKYVLSKSNGERIDLAITGSILKIQRPRKFKDKKDAYKLFPKEAKYESFSFMTNIFSVQNCKPYSVCIHIKVV